MQRLEKKSVCVESFFQLKSYYSAKSYSYASLLFLLPLFSFCLCTIVVVVSLGRVVRKYMYLNSFNE